jgi:hypothetical protein
MDMKMWTCSFQELQLEEQIGEGAFGKVRASQQLAFARWPCTLALI